MQCELFKQRGGKRRGAGRPKKGYRASERHKRREKLCARFPVHVTLRVGPGVPYLRKRSIWRAIAQATVVAAKTGAIRLVHASVQRDHLHLLVETNDQYTLAKGMQAFQISAARSINRAANRKGCVFPDRYHVHILKTPTEAHRAIKYVLCNWRKHGEDADSRHAVDLFSTGFAFWSAVPPAYYVPLAVARAESWLLTIGWQKLGEISPFAVPSR